MLREEVWQAANGEVTKYNLAYINHLVAGGKAKEVRNVVGVPRRVAEAEWMGFRQAIVPAGSAGNGYPADSAMEVSEVSDVREAMRAAFRG